MSILNKIQDKISDGISDLGDGVENVFQDVVWKLSDKADESLDLMDRRMQRRFKKIESKEDNFNALFGLENFKDKPIIDRAKAVFAKEEKTIRTHAEYGDIISVDRIFYTHYGIYVGDNRVIHYAGTKADFDWHDLKNIKIRNDDMSNFLHDKKTYFVVDCEDESMKVAFKKKLLVAYSPEETVQRAESKLGESKYWLTTNNCEHFALWCKTGIHTSTQVSIVLENITKIPISIYPKTY
ncbi:lecithin retinol acyltransferase family protein [Clostridium estertheticum]|uniref:Lecithin retinol acyltransferase family protein n=1 Tax=Clostridium estertheticum TaxID=238834 RepID=A0A7Y3SZ75_9CLOT|nr:lecithin retinol acyltransferase family protein [Clostridium estertheticum]NNU78116.1 lecithin retinol acyltransferase family protein [Clostridium estertheticum]WBL47772.1 lecithin retinol acyltransferase family protein [Clostridium estertheticum]